MKARERSRRKPGTPPPPTRPPTHSPPTSNHRVKARSPKTQRDHVTATTDLQRSSADIHQTQTECLLMNYPRPASPDPMMTDACAGERHPPAHASQGNNSQGFTRARPGIFKTERHTPSRHSEDSKRPQRETIDAIRSHFAVIGRQHLESARQSHLPPARPSPARRGAPQKRRWSHPDHTVPRPEHDSRRFREPRYGSHVRIQSA